MDRSKQGWSEAQRKQISHNVPEENVRAYSWMLCQNVVTCDRNSGEMLEKLLAKIIPAKTAKWEPVLHEVVKDENLQAELHQTGYAIKSLLNDNQLKALSEIYHETHRLKAEEGGMFYGMYSLDLEYRKKVHEQIAAILQPVLEEHFVSYKNIINFFVVKLPGPKSELNIHQDMTSLDEFKYSPLSLWIPLHDIHEKNGAVCVVPKSHRLFSPYRSISFETPYGNLTEDIVQYLRPVYLKKGQALFFDPRILHHSLPNMSTEPRVALVAGIFPEDAEVITCFKEPQPKAEIELLLQPDDFLLTNTNFFHSCTDRPSTGETFKTVGQPMNSISAAEFRKKCMQLGILPYEGQIPFYKTDCSMIGEPVV
jgi:ectoine hydroxylase-related dioxygenase (phytanoyl-CoA dioxygenase family)